MAARRGRKVLIGAAVLGLALVGAEQWLETERGNAWLCDQLESLVTSSMGEGRLQIDGLSTNVVSHLELRGVRLLDGSGRAVVELPRVEAKYNLRTVLAKAVVVEQVLVESPVVDLRTDADGALDLLRMFPSEEDSAPSTGLPGTLIVRDARITAGTVGYHDASMGLRVEGLELGARVTGRHKTWEILNLQVNGQVTEPEMGPLALSTALVLDDRALSLETLALTLGEATIGASGGVSGLDDELNLDLKVRATGVSPDALEVLTGDLGLHGVLGAELAASGPLDALRLQGNVVAPSGDADLDATVNLSGEPLSWSAKLQPHALDLGSFVDAVTEPTVLSGELSAAGSGTSWPEGVQVSGETSMSDSLAWGYHIPGVRSAFEVKEGRVGLKNLRYEAPYGVATGDGVLTESGLALDVRAHIWDLRALEEFSAPGLIGDAEADGELRIDWSGEEAEVLFYGDVHGDALAYETEFTTGPWFTTADVRYDGDTLVSGEIQAENVQSYGLTLGEVRGPWLAEVLESGPIRWEADIAAEQLDGFGGTVQGAAGYVDGSIDEDEVLRTDLVIGLEGLAYDSYTAGTGVAEVHLVGDALEVDTDLWDGDEKVLALNGASDLASSTWRFNELRVGAESGVSWYNREPISLRLTDSGITEGRIGLKSAAGELSVIGQIGESGPLDAEILVDGLQLAWVGAMFPESLGGWTGAVNLSMTLSGTGEAPEIAGDLRVQALSIPAQAWGLDLDAKLRSQGQVIHLDGDLADQKGGLMAVNADVPVDLAFAHPALLTRSPINAQLLLYPVTFQRLQNSIPALGELPRGEISAQLTVTETLIDPQIVLKAGVQTPAGQNGEWVRTDLDLTTHQGAVTLKAAGYEGGQRRMDINGTASTSLRDITAWILENGPEPDLNKPETYVDNLAITAVPLGVPMESIGAFVELPAGLSGRLSGALVLSGRPDRPQLGGGLQITEGKLGDVIISPAVIGITPAEGGYQVFGTFGFTEDAAELGEYNFELAGWVPFEADLGGDFDVAAEMARPGLVLGVRGTGLPLGLLSAIDPAIVDAKGVVQIEGQILGSLAEPKPELDVSLADGSFKYSDMKVNFDAINLQAKVQASAVELRSLRFHTAPAAAGRDDIFDQAARNVGKAVRLPDARETKEDCTQRMELKDGEVTVVGTAQLEELSLAAVNFDVCASKAWFSATDDLVLQLTAGLDMRGLWPDVDVTGDVVSNKVYFSMSEADFFDSGALELDPAIQVIRTGVATTSSTKDKEPPFYYPWAVLVNVDLNRSATIEVTVPLLDTYDSLGLSSMTLDDTELDGQIRYHQVKDTIEIFGDIRTLRGAVEVMGNNFELREGDISFSGETYTNPTLDILAVLDTSSYGEVSVKVSQTAEHPAIDFASDAGYSITDILAILLMGRPTSELGQANSGGLSDIFAFASTQATGVLTQQAEIFGGRGSLVDSFQVGGSDSQMVSTFTFGRSLGDRAYVEVEFNRDPDPAAGDYPTEVGLEYVLNRRLEAVFRVGGESSADIYANWRF